MNTEALKINITQRILSISDGKILNKINDLLKSENIVGYTADGTPITETQFVAQMDKQQERIQNGSAKFYTTDEVRKKILNDNNLGG